MANFIDIPWDNISIIDLDKLIISDNFDCEFFLGHVFNFTEVVVLNDIIHCIDC